MMMRDRLALTTHHVGGREGHGPFPLPDALAADSPIVFYEADPGAVEGMQLEAGRPTVAIGKCVGREHSRAQFNITRKPHGSSLLELDEKYVHAYFHKRNEEPIWGTTFAVARTIDVEVESLDAIVASNKYRVDPPDVLTLDTEGTEYDILEGCGDLLEREIICVVTEVTFIPIRKGQKLYGDVAELLLRKGFLPIRIEQHGRELALYRAPVGLRGRGIQTFADAVFLRDIDALAAVLRGKELVVKLRKLAVAALTFGQLEYALDCLQRARRLGVPELESPPRYWSFLDELERCAATIPLRFLPVAGGAFREPESSTATATTGALHSPGVKERLKQIGARFPKVFTFAVKLISACRELTRDISVSWQKFIGTRTQIEKLLAKHGFTELSESVRLLRIEQSPWVENSRT